MDNVHVFSPFIFRFLVILSVYLLNSLIIGRDGCLLLVFWLNFCWHSPTLPPHPSLPNFKSRKLKFLVTPNAVLALCKHN